MKTASCHTLTKCVQIIALAFALEKNISLWYHSLVSAIYRDNQCLPHPWPSSQLGESGWCISCWVEESLAGMRLWFIAWVDCLGLQYWGWSELVILQSLGNWLELDDQQVIGIGGPGNFCSQNYTQKLGDKINAKHPLKLWSLGLFVSDQTLNFSFLD